MDDIIYVFGGRGVNGKVLGELSALKLSSGSSATCAPMKDHDSHTDQRWYMFQKMGPAPSPRLGHAMASMGSRVFVLGGLDEVSPALTGSEDSSFIHILDTSQFYIYVMSHSH